MNEFVSPLDFAKSHEEEKYISDEDFKYFQVLVLNLAGIALNEKKRDLLKTRLAPYIRVNNFKDYSTYRKHLESLPPSHGEWQNFINLLTTNKTDFFREIAHFNFIEDTLIPMWIKAGKKEVHVWSAACSSGEEPYTLAMFLEKKLPADIKFKILATDIDSNILSKAQNGVYSMVKEHEIPEPFKKSAIDYGTGDIKDWFRIKKSLKKNITFKLHNLMEDGYPTDQMFDLVLCRNVMIYFPKDIVGQVALKLYEACNKDGYLFIGHSESIQTNKTPWVSEAPSIYVRKK